MLCRLAHARFLYLSLYLAVRRFHRRVLEEIIFYVRADIDPCEAGILNVLANRAIELCNTLGVKVERDDELYFPAPETVRVIRDRENAKRRVHPVSE